MIEGRDDPTSLHLGPDYGGRMALGYAVLWVAGPIVVSFFSHSYFMGPIVFLGLLVSWLLWSYGTKAHLDVLEDQVIFLCFVREYTIPWTAIKSIHYNPRIIFSTNDGKKLLCGIYPNWWQNSTFLRQTRFAIRRNKAVNAINEAYESASKSDALGSEITH
jgi:hypothetical protein